MKEPKVRQFRDRAVSVERDHPDGGTFHLLPLDIVRATQMNDALAALDYERDENGNVVIDEDSLQPKKRAWRDDGERIAERIQVIRKWCVARVTNIVDAERPRKDDGSWNFITLTDAQIEAMLAEISTRATKRSFPVTRWDAETKMHEPERDKDGGIRTEEREVPANETIFSWVIEECSRLSQSGEAADEKNSSSTPSGSSGIAQQ